MFYSEFKPSLQYLAIQRYTLSQIGVDLNAPKGKELLKNYWKFLLLISLTIYFEYGLLNYTLHSTIDMTTEVLSVFNQGILILLKMCVFFYKGDNFIKIIWEMNNLADESNHKERKTWVSENRRSLLIGKIYYYACMIAVVCAGILPIVFVTHDYYKGKEVKPTLPFGGKFPYDNNSLLQFILHYVLSMISVLSLLNMAVGIDTLFGWLIYNVSAHFRILRIKVENTALKLEKVAYRNFTKDIGSIVCYHNKILKFIKDFNTIFGFILFAEVMLSCLQMCFSIYSLNNDADIANMPFNCLVLLAIVLQLLIYCFGGEKIKIENDMLCRDFYLQFPWHKMSAIENKLIMLPLMRSQRPSFLSGLFFEVDRSLLVYIIKTAFSISALLSAMKE